MAVWRAPQWLIRTAIVGVGVMAITDIILMRRHKVSAAVTPVHEAIGLNAEVGADGLHLQWDRTSRPIRIADHATLYVSDGNYNTQLNLTNLQLTASSVRYWPKSEAVVFRLDVYSGSQSSSDSLRVPVPASIHPARRSPPDVAVVEKLRPSPFEPAHAETGRRPAPAISAQLTEPIVEPAEPAEPDPPATRWGRMLAKIPLLRHWNKHRESADSK
jgi:hypothetical protein